ncbi:MAG: hypothetical protein OHK0039_06760 [Bacteroidia bacterium]
MKTRRRLWYRILYAGLLAGALVVALAEGLPWYLSRGRCFDTTDEVPARRVGLLLGTSKYVVGGRINLYYRYRIDAAVQLFEAGKVQYLLVSGDNGQQNYNEPGTIRADLLARGIPADRIVLDYAGFRTLDSIVRSRAVFGQERVMVISQPFHNRRALCIAWARGIDAVAFDARDVAGRDGRKVQMRERLARVQMLLDLLLGRGPRYLGEPVPIG